MMLSSQLKVNNLFKIGAKVAVVDDTIRGVISDIKESEIFIKDTDGFVHSYDRTDLVVITEDQKELSKFIDLKHESLLAKDDFKKKKPSKKIMNNRKQPPLEVDLHIHHLTDRVQGMTNYDMLTLQLETAKCRLEFARKKNITRIIFIHGVGQGVLEGELKNLLKNYPVEVYAASFQKYGFGATEVYLYQNPI